MTPPSPASSTADYYYSWVHTHLISKQYPASGLFPRSKSSYIPDNVYCAVTIWALSKVLGRDDDGSGRHIELELTAVKTMRAILCCFTKQLDKLERFKYQQEPRYCLHTKFDPETGDELSQEYKHMQIHSVSLYLFYLAQMCRSGLVLIYTLQECHIIQNLIYYIERAYRIRDFGMWGQGKKDSPDKPELSASSIAITVAALQACDGLNLFGKAHSNHSVMFADPGLHSNHSVLFVDPDALFRNTSILHSLLPRESKSKDVDAALIMAKGFPAFAVQEPALCQEIEENVNSELLGTYGYKRFTGDRVGLDSSRDPMELLSSKQDFYGMECEWPFIVLFQIMTCIFEDKLDEIPKYRSLLDPLLYDTGGYPTVPHYFCFKPGVIARVAVRESPVIVFQAFLILTELLEKKLVYPHELDYRRQQIARGVRSSHPVVQIALLSESTSFQALLSTYGITTQTPNQIESVYIWPSTKLVELLYHHGSDADLGLTGRPKRPLGSLSTSRLWKIGGKTVMCIPLYQDKQDFYICKDETYIAEAIKSHLKFLQSHWKRVERPTFCLLLTSTLFKKNSQPLLKVLNMLRFGKYKDILLKVGRLQELLPSAAVVDIQNVMPNLNFQENRILASPVMTRRSLSIKSLTDDNIYGRSKVKATSEEVPSYHSILSSCQAMSDEDLLSRASGEGSPGSTVVALIELAERHGEEYVINGESVRDLLEHYYKTTENDWMALRCCAGFLGRTVDSLAPAVSTVIVSGRSLSLGVFGHPEILIEEPLHPSRMQSILHDTVGGQNTLHVSLQQEFLIFIADILIDEPALFKGILIIRLGWIIHIMETVLSPQKEFIEAMSPHVLSKKIRELLTNTADFCKDDSWQKYRLINGTLGKVPGNFYPRVWGILAHQKIRFSLKERLLESADAEHIKPVEPMFAMKVEHFLGALDNPESRHFILEMFNVLACTIERNQEVQLTEEFSVMDFVEKSGVEVADSAEEASKKFVSCMIKEEFVRLVNVKDCILS